MCNMCSTTSQTATVDEFGGKLLGIVNNAGLALMISLGHRTGLFDTMSTMGYSTSHEIAERSNLHERYVREWLGALATGGIVVFDPTEKKYMLPKEHAALLTRESSPNNMASTMQWISVLGEVESDIAHCFKHGGGVPYSAYSRFHDVMAEESDQTTVAGLIQNILPICPGLQERLEHGIRVLDVGCGRGRAILELAKQFPNSTFVGYDFSTETVEQANQAAHSARCENVRFCAVDIAEMDCVDSFDLITAFDAIHDQAKPSDVLKCIAKALRSDGLFLMQDIAASSHVEKNIDAPLAPFMYTISCMHCMSVSLEQGGAGLGAVWGKELALEMLKDAGFNNVAVESLEHDIINYYYLAQLI